MYKASKLVLFICMSFLGCLNAQQKQLYPKAQISVLSIGPGTSLNDAFGHSAFRIKDQRAHIDLVFNYGIYDFSTPNFYLKFAQGKLNYLCGVNYYQDFYESYVAQNRTIKEQILDLSQDEKQGLFNYLLNNVKPENRAYLYDFFYDNCATRIRDVLEKVANDSIVFKAPDAFKQKTFRRLIHDHVNQNSWGSFGIDLALGAVIDKKASGYEHMFLPEYINTFFENATFNGSNKRLVKQSRVLYKKLERPKPRNFLSSPLFVFINMSLIILLITYFDYKKKKRTAWLDITLFSITGIIGILMLLLWFATDHGATAQNYNLLWASALNVFMMGQLFRKKISPWFIKYLKFLVIMLCLLMLHWSIGVQVFAITLIPLLIALLLRYVFLIHHVKHSQS